MAKKAELLEPIHPGEILREEFLRPMDISMNQLARDLDVPLNRVSLIVNGTRAITADTALRLATYFGVSPELWLNLQADYDLRSSSALVVRRSSAECGSGPRRKLTNQPLGTDLLAQTLTPAASRLIPCSLYARAVPS
jgi:addiction module HigA family antidote